MDAILLSELIEQTKDSIRSFEHSQSTFYQYQMGWNELSDYFIEHHQVLFSKPLAEQYLLELKEKWKTGSIKAWRYKLYRLTALMLIECDETGRVTWKKHKVDPPMRIHQPAYLLLHREYLNFLEKEGKKIGTIQIYDLVSRQFLEYLEERKVEDLAQVRRSEISTFIPFIAKQYQPGSMRTVLSALRCFIRFVERQKLTELRLSQAIPSSSGRITKVFPTITIEEEQKLLEAVDCTTPGGKRNYAMLLLALRTGLRSIDIINLTLGDIQWKRNTIEIVQSKTGTPLVLPLLTDVGNAIADYILNGRPESQQPYLFLHTQAPYRKLSANASGYGISCKMMKAAGIRQGLEDRKGFHCFRHYVASRLLSEETPLPIISSILGHRNKDSTKVYLSTDLVHLRTCALDLTGIEVTKDELR
ncbi:MAG: site-specific integrase [Thermodesulfovibrionales bacterium]|nr:site-specific integrase [Thermodesulfovibrionales bacterium]